MPSSNSVLQHRRLPRARVRPDGRAAVKQWIEDLLAVGVHSFTVAEAHGVFGGTLAHVRVALSRLVAAGRLVRAVKGFYVIITPEHRSLGAPPPSWYIDPLMAHLGLPYYVALLSAAAIHGAAPQAPQEFQVMTARQLRVKRVGHARIRWVLKYRLASQEAHGDRSPVSRMQRVNTPTGTMLVSTPETTAVDLVEYAHRAGYFSHVASVLDALAEQLDPAALTAACAGHGPVAQRLGYLLDTLGHHTLASAVEAALDTGRTAGREGRLRSVSLSAGIPTTDAPLDPRWKVLVNDTIEPD